MLYTHLNSNEIVHFFIEMLNIHENSHILKALTSSLLEASKNTIFYPDLLNDHSLNIVLQKIINGEMETKSFENLYECIRNILLQTKVPVKYLIASAILKQTEIRGNWKEKEEDNIVTILKVLNFNIKLSDDGRDLLQTSNADLETFSDLQKKALKYSLIAVTNIVLKTNPEFIFSKKVNLVQLLLENANFESDSQLNLRFLYLLYISLDRNNGKELQ